jgi:polyferredoxin
LFAAGAKFAFDGIMNADGMLLDTLDTTINVNETQLLTMILIAGLVSIFVEKRWMQGWALLITTVAAVIITADEAVIAILKSEEVSSLEKWLAAIFTIEALVVVMSVGGALLSTHFFELVWEKAGAWIMWPIIIAGLLYAYLEGLLAI